jgi:hypothetical protein
VSTNLILEPLTPIVEFVERVALRTPDGRMFSLGPPNRHHDVIARMVEYGISKGDIAKSQQGFTNGAGVYLSRKEAYKHANDNNQPLIPRPVGGYAGKKLFSEDLW